MWRAQIMRQVEFELPCEHTPPPPPPPLRVKHMDVMEYLKVNFDFALLLYIAELGRRSKTWLRAIQTIKSV